MLNELTKHMRLITLIKHTFFQDMLDSLLKEFTS